MSYTTKVSTRTVSDNEKEMVIAEALETDEGRVALAQAMVEPIRRALEYQAVGRKCYSSTSCRRALCPATSATRRAAYVIARRGAVPEQIIEGEEIVVPCSRSPLTRASV
jgi:hypothetical protein